MRTMMTALAVLAPEAAFAETPSEWDVMVGGGVMVMPAYPGSEDYRVRPVPAVHIKGPVAGRTVFTLAGPSARLDYDATDRVTVGVKGAYDFGRDGDEDLMVRGLPEVKDGLEVGPTMAYHINPCLDATAEVLSEVLDGHGGTRARAGMDYKMPLGRAKVVATGGVNYGSEDYMNAYFSVPAGAARADRPAYDADGGISHVDAGVMAMMPVSQKWVVQGMAGADYLVGEAADSPLAQRELQPKVGVNLLYRF